MRRVCFIVPPLAIAGAVLLSSAPAAQASCAPTPLRARLAAADAAFVGRLASRNEGRFTFIVDQAVKGGLPPQIDVLDPYQVTSESLSSYGLVPGPTTALLLQRTADGAYTANGCSVVDPARLQAASATKRTTCDAPTALPITVRTREASRAVKLSARVSGGEPGASATIDWGDGRRTIAKLATSSVARVTVRSSHTYRRPGTYRVRLVVSAPLPDDCQGIFAPDGSGPVRSPRASPERTRTVRLSRRVRAAD